MEHKKGLTGATLKIIACITMFIDHSAAIILERYLVNVGLNDINSLEDSLAFFTQYGTVYYIDLALRLIGRIAFPIFVFLLVEGFTHTRSKWKYALRLFIFALISEIPFNFGFENKMFSFNYQNVMFTLLIGFLCIWFIDFVKSKTLNAWIGYLGIVFGSLLTGIYGFLLVQNAMISYGYGAPSFPATLIIIGAVAIITVVILILINNKKGFNQLAVMAIGLFATIALGMFADFIHTDYGAIGIFAIAVMYAFRGNNKKAFALGLVPLTLGSFLEGFAYVDLVVIGKYNGEKGKSNKYAFYLFYPCHILLIHLIAHFVFGL